MPQEPGGAHLRGPAPRGWLSLRRPAGPTTRVRCRAARRAGSQEPGSNQEIKGFAQRQGAKFPLMAKVDVNGTSGGRGGAGRDGAGRGGAGLVRAWAGRG